MLLRVCLVANVIGALVAGGALADETYRIKEEIERIADSQKVKVGVAAIHVQTGETISVNGSTAFPLASAYKVPIAAYAFHLIEMGHLQADQIIAVRRSEYVIASYITRIFPNSGVVLSLLNLIEPMLIYSDNTATDVVLRTVGGGEALSNWLGEIGITDLRVDRSTAEILRDFYGLPLPDDPSISFADQADALFAANGWTLEQERAAYERLLEDPRDKGTALALAELLRRIWAGAILSNDHREILIAIMKRSVGRARLPARLPAFVLPLAHKTGTIGGTVNDAGVMSLPDNAGEVVIVVFVKGRPSLSYEVRDPEETVIADIARAVYDYFLYARRKNQ